MSFLVNHVNLNLLKILKQLKPADCVFQLNLQEGLIAGRADERAGDTCRDWREKG